MVDAIYTFLQGLGFHHPLHPPLTHLPMGLVIACFVFSLSALILSQPVRLKIAYHCSLLAAAALVPTVAAGLLDWSYRYGGSMNTWITLKMVLAPILLVLLLLSLWQHRRAASPGRMLVLYGLAALCAAGLGYSGGELVYGN